MLIGVVMKRYGQLVGIALILQLPPLLFARSNSTRKGKSVSHHRMSLGLHLPCLRVNRFKLNFVFDFCTKYDKYLIANS